MITYLLCNVCCVGKGLLFRQNSCYLCERFFIYMNILIDKRGLHMTHEVYMPCIHYVHGRLEVSGQ